MSAYPVTYDAVYQERRSRLSVFFRIVLVIPHAIVAYLVFLALCFTSLAAWVVVSVTGRYPRGLYDVNAGAVRWIARYTAFAYLLTDTFPPFGLADDPAYPVRVVFAEPLVKYSRLKALFRGLLAIPLMVMAYLLGIVAYVVAVAVWLVAVVTGKQPRGLHDALEFPLAFTTKAMAYWLLLTEIYPPLSNEHVALDGRSTLALGAWRVD